MTKSEPHTTDRPDAGSENSHRRLERVVVGVDGSPGSLEALEWAAEEADKADAELTAILAWPYGELASNELREVRRMSCELKDRMAAVHPTVNMRCVVYEDYPAVSLIEASKDADLLVLGSRGHGGFVGLLLGSIGQHCLNHAPCSVAIVRPREERDPSTPERHHVVVGVDGSDDSNLALHWAVDEALRRGAELDVVGCWVFPRSSTYLFAADVGVPEAAKQVVADAVAYVGEVAPQLVVHGQCREDPPALVLTEASRSADLIVIGSRGLGAFRGLLLGSVSHHLAHHGHCPLMVVRNYRVPRHHDLSVGVA